MPAAIALAQTRLLTSPALGRQDLEEIDDTLTLASKQIKQYMRKAATDKIIMAFLFCIVMGIVAIGVPAPATSPASSASSASSASPSAARQPASSLSDAAHRRRPPPPTLTARLGCAQVLKVMGKFSDDQVNTPDAVSDIKFRRLLHHGAAASAGGGGGRGLGGFGGYILD
eukprot:SAG11_NODE_5605_length_1510_cov_1.582566_2_plen_171_part_00